MKKLDKLFLVTSVLSLLFIIFSLVKYPELAKQTTLNAQLKSDLKAEKKTLVKVVDEQRPIYNRAMTALTDVFTELRTYSSQQGYDAIKDTVKPLLSEDAWKSTNALKDDKYKKVTQFQEEQEFKDFMFVPEKVTGDMLSGTAIVFYTTKMEDREPVATNAIYTVSYDQKTNKITKLKLTGMLEKSVDSTLLEE